MEFSRVAVVFFLALTWIAVEAVPTKRFQVVNTYSHDSTAYTQGLEMYPGDSRYFLEGTGMYGRSELRKVELTTGRVVQSYTLSRTYFGEGVTTFNGFIYQLTWKENVIFKYRAGAPFATAPEQLGMPSGTSRPREGWGITNDGTNLIISDGTSYLYFVDVATWVVVKRLYVTMDGAPLSNLNELEMVTDPVSGIQELWANVWFNDYVHVINPRSGIVSRKISALGLKPSGGEVLNGISYNPASKKMYITGKYWSKLYEVVEV